MTNEPIDSVSSIPVREVMIVTDKQLITPHYIRVYLTGKPETITTIATMTVGVNNKILIPSDKTQPLDIEDTANLTKRTYTHRGVDVAKQHIWIDFVAHGDQAPASNWVTNAQIGDQLAVLMTTKNKALYPPADHYLLVGDATAIPVLSAILESLPCTATAHCIIEVYDEQDQQHLPTLATINMTWLHNLDPMQGSQLANTVKALTLPTIEQSRFAYVAGEFATVKAIRHYLKKEQDWSKDELYAFSYWKAGIAEDRSAKDRLAEKDSE